MRNFTLVLIVSIMFVAVKAQTFNWVKQDLNTGRNLKGMTTTETDEAIIVGYGRTFKKSMDSGFSWQDVDLLSASFDFIDMSIRGSVGYIAGTKCKVIDNPSGGESDIYSNGIVLKTVDGGLSWSVLDLTDFGEGSIQALNPALPGNFNIDIQSVECVNDTVVLAGVRWNDISTSQTLNHSAVFKSTDGGLTWKAITADFGGDVITSFCVIGDDFFIGGNKMLFKGSVGTDVILDLYPILDVDEDDAMFIMDMDVFEGTDLSVVTSVDGIYISSNLGTSFQQVSGLSGANDFFRYNNDVMIAVGSSSKSKATIDGGLNWSSCYPGETCWDFGGVFNDSLVVLGKGEIFKLAITDLVAGNYNWIGQSIHVQSNLHKMEILDETRALVVGYDQGVKITSDKGLSWSDLDMPEYFSEDALSYDFNSISQGNGAAYASTRRLRYADYETAQDAYYSGLIFSSTDNWVTWQMLDNTKIGSAYPDDPSKNPFMEGCFGMDPFTIACVDELNAYVYVDWYDTTTTTKINHSRVFKTTDGGSSWSAITEDFGSAYVTSIVFDGQVGYIAGSNILLKTTDGGANFTDLFSLLSIEDDKAYLTNIDMKNANELYISTSTDGIHYTLNGGESFTKIEGISGANDVHSFDENSFMVVGSPTKTKFTNDGGVTWDNCPVEASIYSVGEIFNDSLYVLCTGVINKISILDLQITTALKSKLFSSNNRIDVLYNYDGLELVSKTSVIQKINVFNSAGVIVATTEPNAMRCKLENSKFGSGIYVVSAYIDGVADIVKVLIR